MKNVDRRQWLKTISLSSGFALLGGFEGLALTEPIKPSSKGGLVKLSSNENPYGPSKRVRDAISNTFDEACRYPFQVLRGLVDAIAEKEGVTKDHVVVTGGSTEGLRAAGLVYGLGGGELIAADPTFHVMLNYGETHGALAHRVPVNDKMEHDLEAMAEKINDKTRLIFICNPNNPTGTLLKREALKDFCTSHDNQAVVFSDEAYYDFITEPDYPSMVELVKQGRNIIVSKTFSKVYGLAGMRVGYLITRPDIANRLKKSVMANTNILAIAAALEALKDDEFYKLSIIRNKEAKEHIYQTLDDLSLEYIKSHTNFVFFKSGRPISGLIADMKKEGVIIGRPFPPFYNWARISTGTIEQVAQFGSALKSVMG
ncbi:MAG: pyridoxal phosphate-dependent aminotransferase [Aurantibacter sp.]